MRDSHNLAWKLAGVLQGWLPEQVLDSYQVEREAHAESVIKLARLMGIVMTGGGRFGDDVRRVVAPVLPFLPGVRKRVLDSETKPLTANRWVRRGLTDRLAGTLCPNARIAGARLDDLNRRGLTLIAAQPVPESMRVRLAEAGGSVIEVARDHDLGKWLHAHRRRAALIRPDWTVLASSRHPDRLLDALTATVGHRIQS
jgi:3-(3-hydroxy-phenyl)propionate hydroxylase